MDQPGPADEDVQVGEVEWGEVLFYPFIQATRRVSTGVAGGMAFYWLSLDPGSFTSLWIFVAAILIVAVGEVFLGPIARRHEP